MEQAVDQLAQLVHGLLAKSGVPGAAVAVVYRDRTIFAKGFGVRTIGHPESVDANTVFQLASLSKPLGMTVIAAAAKRGCTNWNRPVTDGLPWFRLADPGRSVQLTIGDLYAHRSGLPDHAGDSLEDLGFDRTAILQRLRFLPLEPFRARYAYTNFGLTAAAESVAVTCHAGWPALSETLIYQPVGMSSTSSNHSEYARRANRAVGHVRDGKGRWMISEVRQADAQSPAGGASSSVNDMARWMRMVLNLGSVDGDSVVDREALIEALSPRVRSDPPSPPAMRASFYGYGIGNGVDGSGRVRLTHSGAFALGASSNLALLPAENLGIVTLTNGMPVGLPEAINAAFLDLVETGSIQRDWLTAYWDHGFAAMYRNASILSQGSPVGKEGGMPPSDDYIGTYLNDYYGKVRVIRDSDGLLMLVGPKPARFRLSHWRGDVFGYQTVGENAVGIAAVEFRRGKGNRIESLDVENFERGVSRLRKQSAKKQSPF